MGKLVEKAEHIDCLLKGILNEIHSISETVKIMTERNEGTYKVTSKIITCFPNQLVGKTVVSFQLPYHDWKKLESTEDWKRIQEYLEAIKTQ